MKGRKLIAALLTALLAVAVLAPAAFAEKSALDVGTLSNRYERLETIGEAVDGTENVVVTTRIGVLTAANRALDGATVSFSGEAVGDIMTADDDHKWVNLLGSDGSCIGVLVDNDMASRVVNVGDYSTTGSTLQVRGIYSIDCDDHQGELDVHALDVRVLDAGGPVDHYVNDTDINIGMQLCFVGFLLLAVFFALRWFFARREIKDED